MRLPAHPYPFSCGLSGGDRTSSVQKQSHFHSRTHASHSSGGWIKNIRVKTPLFKNLRPRIFRLILAPSRAGEPLPAPPLQRRGHVKPGRSARGSCGRRRPSQLLHKPFHERRHSAFVRWVWRGGPDPIHVRNVMGVQLCGSLLGLRTND